MPTVTISLPDSLKDFLDREVSTKGYGNFSEYFRTLLRDAQERARERALQIMLLEGLRRGQDLPLTDRFWKDLRSEALRLMAPRKPRKKRK